MARSQRHTAVQMFDFSGGINTRFTEAVLAENEAVEILNGHLTARGGIEKRYGFEPHIAGDTATTDAIVGLQQFVRSGDDYVVRLQDGLVEYNNAGTWTDVTGSVTVSTTATDRWVFSTFRDSLIATNGTDVPIKWSGTGNASVITQAIGGGSDTIDKAATLVRHRERIVLGDVTATESSTQTRYGSVIWPSDSGTLDTWSASPTGKIHIDQGDGESITNLQDVLGYLVVFKQNSLHRVTDFGVSATQDRVRVAPVGTPGRHTAVVVGTTVYFLDAVGRFWAYDARGDNEDAVTELSATKIGRQTLTAFVGTRLPYGHLYHDPKRNEIYCFLSQDESATTNAAWVFNINTGGFTRMEWSLDWNVSCPYTDADGNRHLLAGSHTGLVAQLDTGEADNGSDITLDIQTRHTDAGSLDVVKGLRDLDVYSATSGTQQDVTIGVRKEFGVSSSSFTVTLGAASDPLG